MPTGTNKILEFCATDTGTNLLSDTAYSADSQRPIGNQPGVARSVLVNKVLRQVSVMAAALAQYIADRQSADITDALTPAVIEGYLETALESVLLPKAGGNMSGGINESISTVASSATPDIWTATGNVINYTGTTTTIGFAAAPQAGARRLLLCNGAVQFTNGSNLLVPGSANYTVASGDIVMVVALTTTQFRLIIFKADGTLVAGILETGVWSADLGPSGTGTRAFGVIYHNISGRKRRVMMDIYGPAPGLCQSSIFIGPASPPVATTINASSETTAATGVRARNNFEFEVPNGEYYQLASGSVGATIDHWYELDE